MGKIAARGVNTDFSTTFYEYHLKAFDVTISGADHENITTA